jgi:hypothetical protein
MLGNAISVCGATFGTMLLFEGEQTRRVAMHNAPFAYAHFGARKPTISELISI